MDWQKEQQKYDAGLVRGLMNQKPFIGQPWACMALAVAARAIERGRHLTDAEKDENLAKAFEEEGDSETAAKIRAASRSSSSAREEQKS